MSQMVIPKTFQKEDFWNNPWDVGGLIVIGLFISTVLFFIIFAIVFTVVEKTVCEEEWPDSPGPRRQQGRTG